MRLLRATSATLFYIVTALTNILITEGCGRMELSGTTGFVNINISQPGPLECEWIIKRDLDYILLQWKLKTLTFAARNSSGNVTLSTTTPVTTTELSTAPAVTTTNVTSRSIPNNTTQPTPSNSLSLTFSPSTASPSATAVPSLNTTVANATTNLTPTTLSSATQPSTPASSAHQSELMLHVLSSDIDDVIFRISHNVSNEQQLVYSTVAPSFLVHIQSDVDLLGLEFSFMAYNITVPHSNPPACSSLQEFLCDENKCVSQKLTCDGVKHCDDGTDEAAQLCQTSKGIHVGGYVVSAGVVIGILLGLAALLATTAFVSVVVYRRCTLRQHQDMDTVRMTDECEEEMVTVPDSLLGGQGQRYGTTQLNGKGPAVFEVSGLNVYI